MITILTAAAKRAADDARIAEARKAHAVNRVDAASETPAAPAKVLTLAQVIAKNEARERAAAVGEVPVTVKTTAFSCRWNGKPTADVDHRRAPVCKRSGVSGTWQSCKTTRVHFSHG